MDRIDFYETSNKDWYPALKENAKSNRENATLAEKVLWRSLKGKKLGYKFLRQHVILDFIADFACLEKKLVIEVDGGYHNIPEQRRMDELRTHRLEAMGYTIIRFSNEEIYNCIERVEQSIREKLISL